MISSIIQALVFTKIQPNMNEQVKKRKRIYDLHNGENKPKSVCQPNGKQRNIY